MIDYCTILFDEREHPVFILHINSLRHYMPGVFNIKVSVRPEDSEGIALCERLGVEALPHPVYTQSPGKVHGTNLASGDHANRLDLLMKACTSDWVVLSHSDVVWNGNMMLRTQPLMTDEYGILGTYPHGSIAVNRKAYGECHSGFWHYSFRAEYWSQDGTPHPPWVRLVGVGSFAQDPKCVLLVVPSVDVGCMLEIEMQAYTYKHDRGAVASYYHVAGGSYHGKGGVADLDKDAAGNIIPLTEDGKAHHEVIAGRIEKTLADYARFK